MDFADDKSGGIVKAEEDQAIVWKEPGVLEKGVIGTGQNTVVQRQGTKDRSLCQMLL